MYYLKKVVAGVIELQTRSNAQRAIYHINRAL